MARWRHRLPERWWRGAPDDLQAPRGLLRRRVIAADAMAKTASVEGSCNCRSSHVRAPARSGKLGRWLRMSETSKEGVRGVRKNTRMRVGGVSCSGGCSPRRIRARTAAAGRSSGEQFHRPGGVSWRESRGEWKRRSRALYRAKNGRRQRLNSPAITRRKSSLSRAPFPAGGRRRREVSGDVTWDPPIIETKGKKKSGRVGEACWASAGPPWFARVRRKRKGVAGLGLFLFFCPAAFFLFPWSAKTTPK